MASGKKSRFALNSNEPKDKRNQLVLRHFQAQRTIPKGSAMCDLVYFGVADQASGNESQHI